MDRKTQSFKWRKKAAKLARDRVHPPHQNNGEELLYRDERSFMSFAKGLPHGDDGFAKNNADPEALRAAIDCGFVARFDLDVPLGDTESPPTGQTYRWRFHDADDPAAGRRDLYAIENHEDQHRRWEAPTAGFVFELEGPDAQAVTMPPAPPVVTGPETAPEANPELVAELAEVYWLALLRDVPFNAFDTLSSADPADQTTVQAAVTHLAALPFYASPDPDRPRPAAADLSRQNVFRGHTAGERKGPYLSQFLLMGTRDGDAAANVVEEDGIIRYGSIRIDQRVRVATPAFDYMTHWNEYLDVQNAADVVRLQRWRTSAGGDPFYRFMATPRDLATYVHFDALYEAYLNACIILLEMGAPVDPHFATTLNRSEHTAGFALFGGPHVLTLVTEVATRALKAVRFQKYNTHLRLRPEALAARLVRAGEGPTGLVKFDEHMGLFRAALDQTLGGINLVGRVSAHNQVQNARHAAYLAAQGAGIEGRADLPLLPMAFPEGSPMHPSYGAGHATVAGACVTMLKAFFDTDAVFVREKAGGRVRLVETFDASVHDPVAFVPSADGLDLVDVGAALPEPLKLEDELNKLAANISIGRNIAGVHYYSDYIDSARMGEQIACGILEEQALMYPKDAFIVSLTTFDGVPIVIGTPCDDTEHLSEAAE